MLIDEAFLRETYFEVIPHFKEERTVLCPIYFKVERPQRFGTGFVRMLPGCLLLVLMVVASARQAMALPAFQAVVTDAYHPKEGGTIQTNVKSCQLCHAGAPPKLNAFGTDVKASLEATHSKTLTPAILHSLDSKDSDGDGFNNGLEFASDTLPGDSASKPAGAPPAAKPTVPTVGTTTSTDSSANPFDIRTLLLPKHAQHPVIVHFPIALFIISLFFDALGLLRRDRLLAATGYLNLTVAAVTSPLALITGLLAWQFAYGGISVAAFQGTLEQHIVLSIVTTILIWVLWGMRFSKRKEGIDTVKTPYIIIGLIALIIISITGHLGGYLSGVN